MIVEYSYNECESNSRNCFWDYENNSCEHEGTDFRWGGLQCEEPINTSLSKIESNIALEYQINQSTEQAFYLIKEIKHADNVLKAWLNAESMLVANRIIESNTKRFSDEKIASKKLEE